jgi:hypothetical protein
MNDERDEAVAELLDRAVRSLFVPIEERIRDVLRGGSRRRTARIVASSIAVAAFAGVLAWTSLWIGPADDPVIPAETTEPEPTTRTFRDATDGLTVEVPDGWVVADENLTPWLSEPSEILSLGTFPLRVSEHPEDGLRIWDAPVAPAAFADMTAVDVLLSLQEREGGLGGGDLPRPASFRSDRCDPQIGCGAGDIPFRAWWFPFEDSGRGFYLTVAIGNDASPELRAQAWAVADSLDFEPNEP